MKKISSLMKAACLSLAMGMSGTSIAQLITLGSGTVSSANQDPGPINEYYRSSHCQIIYTKAEINAAGGIGGFLTQFGFNITGAVTNPLPNFTIKMKNTTASSPLVYDGINLITVYTTTSYNPPSGGWDLLTLTTPFTWNGSDNILVDVCFDQVSAYTSSGQVMVYSPTVASGLIYVRADTSPQCGVGCNNLWNDKPQAQMNFVPAPIDLGVNAYLKPLGSKKCFGSDTIRVHITNYGSTNIDFATTPASVTVISTGVINATYNLTMGAGLLNAGASKDTTITTSYNMSTIGTYNLKGYTTLPGDGIPQNDTLYRSYTKKPFFSIAYTPNDTICREVPVNISTTVTPPQLGEGSLVNQYYEYPAPYGNNWEAAKNQFLYLASELTAAGVTPGNIQSISFNVENLNTNNPLESFNISMGATSLTSLTSIVSGPTTVFSSASYTPVLGMNTHVLSTPFVWNGTDNILVETCFSNVINPYGDNVSFYQSTVPFNASCWATTLYNTQSTLCTSTGAGDGFSTMRPNTYFGQNTPITYNWSPAAGLSAANIANPVAKPLASTLYTITVSKPTQNCMTFDTLRLTIKETPHVYLGHDTTLCTSAYILNAGTDATAGYSWSPTVATTNSISVSTTGNYIATGTSTTGCTDKDTVHVTFTSPPIVTLGPDTNYCAGSFVTLNAGNNGSIISWTKVGGGFTASTPAVNINTPGTYSVTVTSPLSTSCRTSDAIVITQASLPSVSLVLPNPTILCHFDNPINLHGGLPAGGSYIGAGVVGGNSFNPALVGPGTYIIVYNYTGSNGCPNQASDTMRVKTCTGIDEQDGLVNLVVFPNPNDGVFTISIHSTIELNASLKVVTIDGRLVHQEQISTNGGLYENKFNISDLANGIYYLRLESEEAIRTFKLLKQ